MKEFIDKLIERLEENGQKMCEAKSSVPFGKHSPSNHRYYKAISVKKAKFIINQLAEEYDQTLDVAELVEKFGQKKVRRNADRIRAMSDEELAEFLQRFGTFNQPCSLSVGEPLKWLQSEAE